MYLYFTRERAYDVAFRNFFKITEGSDDSRARICKKNVSTHKTHAYNCTRFLYWDTFSSLGQTFFYLLDYVNCRSEKLGFQKKKKKKKKS